MATARVLTNISAAAERGGSNGDRLTGQVAVHALPAWLKGDQFATGSISPADARRLALQLLAAAERAEGNPPRV